MVDASMITRLMVLIAEGGWPHGTKITDKSRFPTDYRWMTHGETQMECVLFKFGFRSEKWFIICSKFKDFLYVDTMQFV